MKKENLNPFALKVAEDLMKVRTNLPLASAIASVNYKMANIASQMHIRVDTKSGYKPTPVNLYSLVLLVSGGGKNSSLGLLDRWFFGDAFFKIKDLVYPHYRKQAYDRLEEAGIERDIHNWTQSMSNSTISGMYAYAESYSLTGFGSLNIEVDEIGNAVISKAELFENLLTPYDNGDFMPVAKRSDANSMDISGLPVNLYCFGNRVRLMDGDKTEQSFIQLLDEGYGRRFIFVDDDSKPKPATPQEVMNEMKVSEQTRVQREPERIFIKELIDSKNFNKVLDMTDEAMFKYATIKADGDAYVYEHKGLQPAVVADITERHFKTIKLAGIYAFFDGSDVVEGRHIDEAFEVVKASSEVLTNLRKIKPLHERLLDYLLNEPEKITAQTMLSYPFINSGWTKKILEIVELAKQLASERNYEWDEVTKDGVTYYRVIDTTDVIEKDLF